MLRRSTSTGIGDSFIVVATPYLIPSCEEADLSLVNAHELSRLRLHAREAVRGLAVHEHRSVLSLQPNVPGGTIDKCCLSIEAGMLIQHGFLTWDRVCSTLTSVQQRRNFLQI